MFFKKNIFLLILIFTFFFIINKKVSAIDPVEIGIKYQKDVEINLSVIENIKGLKTERISIDRDIRTKKNSVDISIFRTRAKVILYNEQGVLPLMNTNT